MKNNKMKLHIGCGTIYLKDYINVDIDGLFASENISKMKKNKTDFKHYYSKSNFFNKRKLKEVIIDYKVDIVGNFMDKNGKRFRYADNSIEEIIAIQILEHIPYSDNIEILKDWYRMLTPKGKLFVSVPDIEGNCKKFLESKTDKDKEFAIRLIYGTGKNKYFTHYVGYWKEKLIKILKNVGFKNIKDISPWVHFYPAIVIEAFK